MSKCCSAARAPTISDAPHVLQIQSNKISNILAENSKAELADIQHARLTSTPGDDLAEEDFADRVHSVLEPMTGLVSLTVCIPSMARLHPSNSLPKVLDVLHDASILHPRCRLGLAVHEAEQAWSALTILNRVVEKNLSLQEIEFSRAYFPVEVLIQTAQACGLESLNLHVTQVSSSSSLSIGKVTPGQDSRKSISSISTLTSLTVHDYSEVTPGLDFLLDAAASSLTHLDLSSSRDGSLVLLGGLEFPRLIRLTLNEDLLQETSRARMVALRELVLPTLSRIDSPDAIQEMLQSSCPQVTEVRVSHIVAGNLSEALTRFGMVHNSVKLAIGELAVREPMSLSPATLAISEHLVNVGPPIAGDWPRGFERQRYERLKSIVLKVHEGYNHDEFIASLDVPNLDSPPRISLIGRKKEKTNKR